jgi:hypothetical protein
MWCEMTKISPNAGIPAFGARLAMIHIPTFQIHLLDFSNPKVRKLPAT